MAQARGEREDGSAIVVWMRASRLVETQWRAAWVMEYFHLRRAVPLMKLLSRYCLVVLCALCVAYSLEFRGPWLWLIGGLVLVVLALLWVVWPLFVFAFSFSPDLAIHARKGEQFRGRYDTNHLSITYPDGGVIRIEYSAIAGVHTRGAFALIVLKTLVTNKVGMRTLVPVRALPKGSIDWLSGVVARRGNSQATPRF